MTDSTEYFRKASKLLLRSYRVGEETARDRVARVFRDLQHPGSSGFTLMRAQHVIATEHGFPSWDALTAARPIDHRLRITMQKLPRLSAFGIGVYDEHVKTKTDRDAELLISRAELQESGEMVERILVWLRSNIASTKTINARRTSYGLKHVAERDLGYVTNGAFIAAAVIAGYPYRLVPGSPNPQFGMSERSVKAAKERRATRNDLPPAPPVRPHPLASGFSFVAAAAPTAAPSGSDEERDVLAARATLREVGQLSWTACVCRGVHNDGAYDTKWELECPLCGEGTIVRSKDDTPGFKFSSMTKCGVCGLTGDGSSLSLETAGAAWVRRST